MATAAVAALTAAAELTAAGAELSAAAVIAAAYLQCRLQIWALQLQTLHMYSHH